jgi:hypothetical protein
VPVTHPPPSTAAAWEEFTLRRPDGGLLRVMLQPVPSPAGGGRRWQYLPQRPELARAGGAPAASLTVILSARPAPADDSIAPLVEQALLACTVTLALEPEAVRVLSQRTGGDVRPLFAQSVEFAIVDETTGARVAAVAAAGGGARGALSITLGRRLAQRLLASLEGGEAGLVLETTLGYRRVIPAGPGAAARPLPAVERIRSTVPLLEVLAPALAPAWRDRVVHLVAPSTDQGALVPLPRLRSARRTRDATGATMPGRPLAPLGRRLTSLAVALTPESTVPTGHALLASDVTELHVAGHAGAWLADDFVLGPLDDEPPLSLPIVESSEAPIWRDRVDGGLYWYAPGVRLVAPAPADDPAIAAFAFSFTQSGVTASGRPGLDAEARFTLETFRPPAVEQALAAARARESRSVPLNGLSVGLALPFRAEGTGTTTTQLFPASVSQAGDRIVATVALLDDWARLCYGALAYEGFQAEPARLSVAYSYPAYVSASDAPQTFIGGKIALMALAATRIGRSAPPSGPVFDPASATLYAGGGSLQLQREMPVRARGRGARPGAIAAIHATAVSAPAISTAAVVQPAPAAAPVALVHPALGIAPALVADLARVRYATRTLVRDERVDALFPCAVLGGLYVQLVDGIPSPVGCRDLLKLGEVIYRQYDELADLAQPGYRVFRSLQQPGRFLVLPAQYRITRYGPGEPGDKAYRPTIMIYAVLGVDETANRYYFSATLQPDVPGYLRHELSAALAPLTPSGQFPRVDFPTDPAVQATPSYRWTVPDDVDDPEVHQVWDGFQVSLSTGLASALALTTLIETSGVSGAVRFALADGTTLTSALTLDTMVTGPWSGGPVETAVAGTRATLTNRIERPVSVTDFVALDAAGAPTRVAVDGTLVPGGSCPVDLPAGTVSGYPVYSVDSGALKLAQLGVYVEDVETNVLLINLVNFANHDLAKLRVEVRLESSEHVYVAELLEGQTASVDLTLGLTTYLEAQVLQFRITQVSTGGDASPGGWIAWNLATQGNAISLTPALLTQ